MRNKYGDAVYKVVGLLGEIVTFKHFKVLRACTQNYVPFDKRLHFIWGVGVILGQLS
jgi:hypothetical protein